MDAAGRAKFEQDFGKFNIKRIRVSGENSKQSGPGR